MCEVPVKRVVMTKKEKQQLHTNKCQIEAIDAQLGRGLESRYIVSFSLTAGELIALNNTFVETEGRSPVGDDLAAFLRNALERAGIKV